MPDQDPPPYRRYRAGRRIGGREEELRPPAERGHVPAAPPSRGRGQGAGVAAPPRPSPQRQPRPPAPGGGGRAWRHLKPPSDEDRPRDPQAVPRWRAWLRPRRIITTLVGLVVAWVLVSLLLFLISSHFERIPAPAGVRWALKPGGNLLTSANNILVLGSDRRQKNSKEPGAHSGPSRSDTMMLIRTGGGHAARLSIPRDTVVDIPGHGEQKINAAFAFGGPSLSIKVVEHYLGIPINHVVIVNFEDFPALIDAMGGVNYTGGCVFAKLDGGSKNGGFTLRLPPGTHHLDGREALALARTRENLCNGAQTDIQREERQQALFNDMKARLLSFSSFLRLPLISWAAPPTIISDLSGEQLLEMFASLEIGGTPPTRILRPSGNVILPEGGEGLEVSRAERRRAVARFLAG